MNIFNNMHRRFALAVLTLSVVFTSCQKYLDVNVDPNRSLTTTPQLALTSSQLYIGQSIGDRVASQSNVWNQYWTTGPGTALGTWDQNSMLTSDGNQLFNTFYLRSLNGLNYIIKKTNQPVYAAIAKILMAYEYQYAVDLFGDVPFSEALKGDIEDGALTSPKYDDAQVVYNAIITLVDEGISALDTTGTGFIYPSSDDIIFGGDLIKWKAFAYSLKLKLYMRQSGIKDVSAEVQEIYENGFFLEDLAAIRYTSASPKNANPLWYDLKSSIGNTYAASKTSIDYLISTDDPRIDYFYNKASATNTHVGLKQGDVENSPASASYSTPNGARATNGGIIFGPDVPVILMSPWEVNFLLAEAAAKGYIAENDESLYEDAVTLNFQYFGTPGVSTYLSNGGAYDNTSLETKIKSIALQKWVSFNGTQTVESWIETRRLDSPANPVFTSAGGIFMVPTNNVLGGSAFPSIYYYPQTEADFNTKFPGQNQLTDKVFWDN
ncbi:MAG: SusD/RagB family nutrient-binding outer membrane lipoprotein [Chitinophagales bacterium]|nr:SusD/RagB family nutrient-binding outer membrane lipoprotein [Chitinophagales bacterium]